MEITTHVLTSKQTLSTDQQHQARKNVQAVGAVKVNGSTTISPDPNNNDIVDLSDAFYTIQNAIENVRQVPTVQSSDNGKVLGVTDANGSIGWVEPQTVSQVNADWTATEGVAKILHKPDLSVYAQAADLSSVATSGSYNDLENKPEIPAAQVKADWNASGTVAEILNKPTIPIVDQAFDATSTNAQSGVAVSGAVSGKYEKPSGGIPATDLESAVQTSLGKSDSAIQGVKVNHSLLTPDADKVVDVVVDEVPTVTSTDNGKVLKASYNNGVASYAWQSEGGGSQSVVDQHYSASSTNAQSGTAVAEAIGTVRQVPSTQSSDENKVLGVTDANGTLGWVTPAASQVNADWNATSGAAEILNKPSLAAVATSGAYSDLSGTPDLSNYVTDASYVHTDNNYTNADKSKLAGIAAGAEVNVQSDWNQTDDTADDFIKNKPTIPSFSQNQMDAIDSGITSTKVGNYDGHLSNTDVHVTTSDKTAWNAKYDKPSGGIPKADLADTVQTSLGKADTALQEHQDISGKADKSEMSVVAGTGTDADKTTITLKSGTSATVLTSHQDISGKQDVISDLSDIRSGAEAGATAVQPGDLAAVATSGSYSDLSNKPTIPAAQVNSDWNASSGVAEILNKPSLSAVATSGSYTDLTDTPSIPAAQVNSDWDASSGVAQILNKPSLATVATSGDYDDLTNKPSIPDAQVNSDWNASSGVAEILNKPSLATVATSGDYDDLTNKPSIPAAQVNSDWDASSGVAQILNKPTLAAVATSGSYNDLSNKPTIPAAQVQSDWEQDDSSEVDYIKNKPSLASVATSGSYSDLSNKPSIPAAQVNSDWDAVSGVAQILNKPSIPSVDQSYGASSTNAQSGTAVAEAIAAVRQVPSSQSSDNGKVLGVTNTSGSLGWVDQPADELPSITGNGGKVLKVNAGATAVEWDDETDTTYESKTAAESGTDVSLVTTGEKYTWNHKQDALSFDGTYNASSNKVATESTVSSAVQALDAEVTSSDGTNVQVKVTEANGKVTAVNITTDNTESKSNKKQSIDSTSETEYPSSKAVANFVNSSVATATARFLGSFTLTNLGLSYGATNAQIATALDNHTWPSGTTPTNNDYVYVEIQDPQTTGIDDEVRRFKFNGTVWAYEYTLNNSSFTAAEKAAIDSGITATAVSNYNTHIDDTDIHVTSSDKSDWNAKYDLPSGGIPSTDLSSDVQTSLGKADSAYQLPSGGIPDTDLSSGVQASLDKADTALQSHQDISGKADKVSGATTGNFAGLDANGNITDSGSKAGDFATTAQGAKADSAIQSVKVNGSALTPDANKAVDITVPAAQVKSDWNSSSGLSEILNKPDLSVYALKSEMSVTAGTGTDADKMTITLKSGTAATVLTTHQDITGKQDVISDLSTIRSGAEAGATAYQKPSGGIPDTDLSSAVQESLGKADTALQSHQDISGKADKVSGATNGNFAGLDSNGNLTDSGSKAGDFATAAQGGKADTAVQPGDLATVATSGSYTDLSNTPDLSGYALSSSLATVATSGDYNDLDNLPTIPTVDQSYGAASTNAQSGVAVASAISDKADKVSGATNGNFAGLDSNGNLTDSGSKAGDFATTAQGAKADSAYQLPSGGMPSTDMASGVQTSLGKADSAIQSVKVNSTALTPDANKAVDITINNSTVTIDMAGTASAPNRAVGSFTVDQASASTITIPAAVSAVPAVLDQNNEVVTAAVPAQPGVLSSGDKEKLDGLFNVTGSSTIAINPSTHAVSAIVGPDGGVVAGANGLIVQPDLVSRVVYVGADCVYNDKTFWSDSTTVDGIIADYANQTVTDYRGNGVPLARFVAEYDSNRYRIAAIDETPGTVEYNRKIGGQIIDLMRSDFWMSSHPTYDIIKFDKDMDKLFDLLMTGSPMNAYLLLNDMTSTAFITDARREMYMDMIKAYDAWPYADKDTAYADFMAEHALDRFVQVSTTWPLNSWNSYRYVMAGTPTATDKMIFVIRHAERGSDTSVNGDINSTGVTTCTTMGEQVRNNTSWSGNTISNFPANDATYYSTEYLRCKHSAQAFASARYDTDFAASDYSGITVEADLLYQYRFFYQPAESGNSTLIRNYSVDPTRLSSSELSNYFGVSSAAEAQEKLSNDYVRVCKEILNKSTARLNMFYTHDFFTLPLAVMASNKYYTFSGSGTDNNNWINYCAGIGMILHPDNTYEVMPVRGKSNGTMTI